MTGATVFAFATVFFAAAAQCGIFSVSPVRIHMTPRDRAVAVTVVNEGTESVALQADLNVWTQKADGTDELKLSDDLILSPPIIRLAPKARQVVRLALLVPANPGRQLSYRLIMREIPEATLRASGTVHVPVSLALSMPVFITPPKAARDVSCTSERDARDTMSVAVTCTNGGTAYAQIREVSVMRNDAVEAAFEGGVYILPGAKKTIAVKSEKLLAAGPVQLRVGYDDIRHQLFEARLP
ncbi:MAG: fimbria/pilus periplasmic chaperone [Betaproteobacteria bacterium]